MAGLVAKAEMLAMAVKECHPTWRAVLAGLRAPAVCLVPVALVGLAAARTGGPTAKAAPVVLEVTQPVEATAVTVFMAHRCLPMVQMAELVGMPVPKALAVLEVSGEPEALAVRPVMQARSAAARMAATGATGATEAISCPGRVTRALAALWVWV